MNKVYKTPEVERQYIRIFKETAKKIRALRCFRNYEPASRS